MPDDQKPSLFGRLMKGDANLYQQEEELRAEAHTDHSPVPMANQLLDKMKEAFDAEDLAGVAEALGMSERDVREALNIMSLASVIEDVGGKHAMLYIIDPEHECFFDRGVVPDEVETPDMKGEESRFSFETVERSMLGILMLIRFALVEREGIELRPHPTFPDVPQNVLDGKPGQSTKEITFDKCEDCGEYTVLCTCDDKEDAA